MEMKFVFIHFVASIQPGFIQALAIAIIANNQFHSLLNIYWILSTHGLGNIQLKELYKKNPI